MANRHRGEVEARLDGKPYRLVLTLGALAELEEAFGADDMVALVQRFEQGRIRSNDAMKVIGAGLRGAGADITDADVSQMRAEGGAGGYVDIVARLLRATFASESDSNGDDKRPPPSCEQRTSQEEGQSPGPFHGTT
ncbi:MAG: gene transfer agent family protein [Alphaproteobacteria bacterium]|nr:gene transfer agent family protein [Alphaproteobacteria bacterium]